MADAAEQKTEIKGNRWIGSEPTPDEVKTWFAAISLHDGLEHKDYLGGITLVSATEKVPTQNERGAIVRQERPIFTPYPKVETRVKYFTDLMLHKEEEWVGLVKPIPVAQQEGGAIPSSLGLTDGFHYTGVKTEKGIAVFIVYSVQASVYRRSDLDGKMPTDTSLPLLQGVGTKQVPVLRYPDKADENAMMKAQTGAVGRALGMIGMLVLPGAGVATADDVEEAQAIEDRGGPGATQGAPGEDEAPEQDDAALRGEAGEWIRVLQDDFPAKWEEIQAWSRERNFGHLSDLTGPALKGFVRKVKKAVEDARSAQEERAAAEGAPDVPLAPGEPEDGAEEAPSASE